MMSIPSNSLFIVSFFWFLVNFPGLAQEKMENNEVVEEAEETDSVKSRNGSFLVLPIITYSPETSLRLGVISIYFFRGKDAPEGTQLSTIKLPLNYTLNNQIKARLSYEIFLNDNKHIFKGVAEWIKFPGLGWFIGNNSPDASEEVYITRTRTFG